VYVAGIFDSIRPPNSTNQVSFCLNSAGTAIPADSSDETLSLLSDESNDAVSNDEDPAKSNKRRTNLKTAAVVVKKPSRTSRRPDRLAVIKDRYVHRGVRHLDLATGKEEALKKPSSNARRAKRVFMSLALASKLKKSAKTKATKAAGRKRNKQAVKSPRKSK